MHKYYENVRAGHKAMGKLERNKLRFNCRRGGLLVKGDIKVRIQNSSFTNQPINNHAYSTQDSIFTTKYIICLAHQLTNYVLK